MRPPGGRVRAAWSGWLVVRSCGMQVVQTPSPWAMVASRWTWRAEQPGEDLGLGLAQLRELVGDVGDRAVVLAELLADRAARARWRRSPSAVKRSASASAGRRASGPAAVDRARSRARRSATRRRANSTTASSPPVSARKRSACDGEVVVLLVEGVAAGVGEREDLGGAARGRGCRRPAARAPRRRPSSSRCVEVAADGGRGQLEPLGQLGGGRRAVLQDGPRDPLAGRGVPVGRRSSRPHELHNASVTLDPFSPLSQIRPGRCDLRTEPATRPGPEVPCTTAADSTPESCYALGVVVSVLAPGQGQHGHEDAHHDSRTSTSREWRSRLSWWMGLRDRGRGGGARWCEK